MASEEGGLDESASGARGSKKEAFIFIDPWYGKWLEVGGSGLEWNNHAGAMDSNSQPQKFFAGEFRHSVDEKNRITIPSRWRRKEAVDFIILPEPHHQYLLVMSQEEFARMSAQAETDSTISARDRRIFSRQLHSRAEHGASDRQGRLVLPEDFCKELGLKGEVALVGGRGRFEIWNLQKWKRAHEEETPTYQHVANVIGL